MTGSTVSALTGISGDIGLTMGISTQREYQSELGISTQREYQSEFRREFRRQCDLRR